MRQSQLFSKTLREAPKDEVSINAKLLERGGFVYKNSAGIYSYLPLGWRVLYKITNIIREEINAIGGQEMFMQALIEKKYMEPTGRFNLDVGFFVKGKNDTEANFVLGWSHEEVMAAVASKYVTSYKDLPFAAYQIQTKFRNEARAKSGLLRGREFMMKDLYSFHATENDLGAYYGVVKEAYFKIFNRCGLKSIYTLAGGGVFTENFTHEFQVLSEIGEDVILLCSKCKYAENKEITKLKNGGNCPICLPDGQECKGKITEEKSIEVGNIFNQGAKYSEKLGLYFTDKDGEKNPVLMGAYGIGISRLLATIVETNNDLGGIIWPETISPFKIHLIRLNPKEEKTINAQAESIYKMLLDKGIEVLYDDRADKTAGEKFSDADLIGIPKRMVISEKTLAKNSVEIKDRKTGKIDLIKISNIKNAKSFI
ncbi:MAG: aminoacyl--tRNA ligase-related protein [Patescibacteria group bacterium]